MRTVGLIFIILGALIFAGGSIAFFVNLTSTYAQSICYRAADDKEKFYRAKTLCKDVSSDCYQRTIAGLTSDSDCDYAKSSWMKAIIVSGAIAASGFIMAIVGFFVRRRRAMALT